MQSLTYQQSTGIHSSVLINRAQPEPDNNHELIRAAVRGWSAAIDNQDVVSALIINEYREQGGTAISFPEDISRARQKLFRFLDNRFDSEQYRENVRKLTPAIMAVLPLEYREKLMPEDSLMARLVRMEKETSEAKIAVAMDAPRHQKLKELSEGIVEMYRVDSGLTGPLMEMVQMMLGVV
ncbi:MULTISPECIES: toxin YdaT domain-containing protein [unclassified Escherichia]|uniref:toxin YdaT domain-containing protein n=1 Tax=unclassified Escherichia TaxID=2608889 RepID=UPI001028CC43|nr:MULTISPECIES: toxin YdaT domain-containing protein [unclassified Escherichia]RZM88594.1 regulator [Escherichia sp. E1V33]TBR69921.1 regulator [Escherichia sp. E1S7]